MSFLFDAFKTKKQLLFDAVEKKDAAKVLEILSKQPSLINEGSDSDGRTVLMLAVEKGYIDIVKVLLVIPNIDVNIRDDSGKTSLLFACLNGYKDIVKDLLAHPNIDINIQANDGSSSLHCACYNGNKEMIKELLTHPNIDVNIQSKDGKTSLHCACEWNGKKDIVKDLLAHPNVDVNIQDKDGKTSLHFASRKGHYEIVKELLTHPNLDVNIQDKKGYTSLHCASHRDANDIVKDLLAHPNIDVNIQTKVGDTSLHCACENGNTETVKELLTHPNIDVNIQNKKGYTSLHWACDEGRYYIVKELLTHPNNNIDIQDKAGKTASDVCCDNAYQGNKLNKNTILDLLEKHRQEKASMKASSTAPSSTSGSKAGKVDDTSNATKEKAEVTADVMKEAAMTKDAEKNEFRTKNKKDTDKPQPKATAPLTSSTISPETKSSASKRNEMGNEKEVKKDHSKQDEQKEAEERYMKEALAQGKREWGRSKIMLVGEGRAGKTALANSILGRKYDSSDSTVGINEFTVNVGYASIGQGRGGGEGQWSEYSGHKQQREYEVALAKLISDKKAGREKGQGKEEGERREEELETLLNHKVKGGYVEGEEVRLLSQAELERGLEGKHAANGSMRAAEKMKEEGATIQKKRDKQAVSNADVRKKDMIPTAGSMYADHDEHSVKTGKEKTKEKESQQGASNKTTSEIDKSLVMQYLGEKSCVDSKFIVSVFDFGGQSVFDVIHPFFLTRCGVYVLVFNMEWLSSGASREVKEDCVSYLTFWLNSIIIHSQNEKGEVAPILFVGTRKDVRASPAEHLKISTKIYEVFSGSLAWPYVVKNLGAEGPNGKTNLCFYPVNNRLSHEDETVQKMLRKIEETMDGSSYVHVERPLSWFQVLDALKAEQQQGKPYLKYEEAKRIIMRCGIPEDKVSLLLRFFHEMGILMWHDEDKLRDVVVFDPIEYFVKPATIVICKHVPDEVDGIHHCLEIHELVMMENGRDFQEMTKHGILTEKLLQALMQGHEQNYGHIRQLMLKYGLLVPLSLQGSEKEKRKEAKGKGEGVEEMKKEKEKEMLYLAPALLPEMKGGDKRSLREGSISTQFYFLFSPLSEVESMTTISLEDCGHLGFLPHGLFEKLISKAIMWSMKTSDFVSRWTLHGCYKNAAELAFGNQTFRIFADARHHLISVVVDGKNPVGIHDRLVDQLKQIIAECLKSLKFITMLRYEGNGSLGESQSHSQSHKKGKGGGKGEEEEAVLFIRLDQVRAVVQSKTALSLNLAGGRSLLSAQDAMRVYGAWLVDYTAFDEYDMFISYRWGERDSDFTLALFDRMTLYSVEESRRAIRAFLDRKRLQVGENFQSGFLRALLRSMVMVPIVSVEALERMKNLGEEEEDNVLIEWICGLECMKLGGGEKGGGRRRLMKIMPVFFGSRSEGRTEHEREHGEAHIGNLFQERMIDQLPKIVPRASLSKAKSLLESNGMVMSEESMKSTVKGVVQEVFKFLFLCAWEVQEKSEKSLISHAAEMILPELESGLALTKQLTASPAAAVVAVGNSSANVSQKQELSLNKMKDLINEELGLSSHTIPDVIKDALDQLTEEDKEKVNREETTKAKIRMIAKILELV